MKERNPAAQVLGFYESLCPPNDRADTPQALLRDLLTDLLHHADGVGLDFDKAVEGAREVATEEQMLGLTPQEPARAITPPANPFVHTACKWVQDALARARGCGICKSPFNDTDRRDCGGDCLRCMAEAGDPDCVEAIREIDSPESEPEDEGECEICAERIVLCKGTWRRP